MQRRVQYKLAGIAGTQELLQAFMEKELSESVKYSSFLLQTTPEMAIVCTVSHPKRLMFV